MIGYIGLQISVSGSAIDVTNIIYNIDNLYQSYCLATLIVLRMNRKYNGHASCTVSRRGYGGQQKGTIL